MPEAVRNLEASILKEYHVETGDYFGLSGTLELHEILNDLLAVLFPGCYGREKINIDEITYYLHDKLRHIGWRLIKHLKVVFLYQCSHEKMDPCECVDRSHQVLVNLVESLPAIRSVLIQDIRAALEGDPAAYSLDEIVLSYPFVEAITTHRIAHKLYEDGVPIVPRIMSERAHSNTGIDIHPGADIGPGFFIDHGTGVVIGETCSIGQNVKLYQGVTLGATSPFDKEGKKRSGQKRHPTIEDDVIIYANATILGGTTVIGKGSIIGGNTWITSSVPANTTVYRTNNKEDIQTTVGAVT